MTNRTDPLVVITSNRGPFSFTYDEENDTFSTQRGSGGLVTALGSLAEQHQVLWVASAMSEGDRMWAEKHQGKVQNIEGVDLTLFTPDEESYSLYYNVISNPLLWFIQHQLWGVSHKPSINYEVWQAWENGYVAINKQCAEAVVESLKDIDPERPIIIFPQDYHLYLTPKFIRERLGARVQIQPFIHIPWPGPDAWRILPGVMRSSILTSLLESDRIGFQTEKDAFNFVQTCRFYLDDAHSRGSRYAVYHHDRKIDAKTYPISVDVNKMYELAEDPQTRLSKNGVMARIADRRLILRVDRIEPSKNILRGLEAYKLLLDLHPEYIAKVQMLALLVPSRMEVDEYQNYMRDIMAESGLINAKYSDQFWEPVQIVVGENYHRAIAAMQLYDVLLVNPLTDGMNLVAKEGVLVNQRDGVLILSEYAGASFELGEEAITVSPFDTYGTAEAIHEALTMPEEERRRRSTILREIVEKANISQWFYTQLEDALTSLNSQAKKDSTSSTPDTNKSEDSLTD